jgi:hypothetical protein
LRIPGVETRRLLSIIAVVVLLRGLERRASTKRSEFSATISGWVRVISWLRHIANLILTNSDLRGILRPSLLAGILILYVLSLRHIIILNCVRRRGSESSTPDGWCNPRMLRGAYALAILISNLGGLLRPHVLVA